MPVQVGGLLLLLSFPINLLYRTIISIWYNIITTYLKCRPINKVQVIVRTTYMDNCVQRMIEICLENKTTIPTHALEK